MMNDNETDERQLWMEPEPAVSYPIDRQTPQETRAAEQTLLFRRVLWAMWWAGTVLIVLSGVRVVSNTMGWIGFAAALASSFISVLVNKHLRMPR